MRLTGDLWYILPDVVMTIWRTDMLHYRVDRPNGLAPMYFANPPAPFDPLRPAPVNSLWDRAIAQGLLTKADYYHGAAYRCDNPPADQVITLAP